MNSMKSSLRRRLYRGRRPHHLAQVANRFQTRLAAAGLGPSRIFVLEVPGRHSGRTASCPVVVADHEGERYLVSMFGDGSGWVRNVRAAGGHATLRHRKAERVRLVEVDIASRAPIIRRYLECAPGARAHFPVDRGDPIERFEALAPRVPVFRVTALHA